MKDDPWDLEHLDISDYSKEELESYIRRLETENAEINEKLDSKRKTIKSLCEELDSLRIVSIEIERLRIENKHLQESRPQSELDAAHLAAENAMLNANFARYISATQDTEKQNERLASMVRELQDENAALREKAERYRLVTLKQDAELAALRSFLREAITDHVSPYDLPESEDYIARVRAALGQDKP